MQNASAPPKYDPLASLTTRVTELERRLTVLGQQAHSCRVSSADLALAIASMDRADVLLACKGVPDESLTRINLQAAKETLTKAMQSQ